MRTKTLIIAAAAMAVGVVSSLAQTTYSQNIVGYVNLTVTNGALYTVVTPSQLTAGASNGLNEVFQSLGANQSGDIVYVWSKSQQKFLGGGYYFFYDTTATPPQTWYDQAGAGSLVTSYPVFSPGDGAFILGSGVAPFDTVTFSGTVPINPGNSGTNVFLADGAYSLVGSQLPVAGGLRSLGFYPPDGTVAYIWSITGQGFKGGGYAYYDAYGWYDGAGGGNPVTGTGITFTNVNGVFSDIPIAVGDSVFVFGGGSGQLTGGTNWVESLAP